MAFNQLQNDAATHAASVQNISSPPVIVSSVVVQAATSYQAGPFDAGSYLRFTNAGAVTFTVPANSVVPFPIGTEIEFEQAGTGAVTVVAGAIPAGGNVTLLSRGADFTLAGQYSVACLKKVAADTWVLTGDL